MWNRIKISFNPTSEDIRRWAAPLSAIIPLFFGVIFPYLFSSTTPLWPWVVGWVIAVCLWLIPIALKPFYITSMVVVELINWLTTHVILVTVFFLIITPYGFIRRRLKPDPLHCLFDKQASSYRFKPPRQPASFLNPY